MNKNEFINYFNEYEDKNSISLLYDKFLLANKANKELFTNEFYPPYIWSKLSRLANNYSITLKTEGIFELSERRLIGFNTDQCSLFPMKVLKIENKSKFSILSHKDYLGAVMALGIKRNKFGDFIVNENCCYTVVHEDIYEYVLMNLNKIGNSSCKVSLIENLELLPQVSFNRQVILVSSDRVDCIISSICNISRSKAQDLVASSKVMVNYIEINEKDALIKEKDIITVRGYGKFRMGENIGTSVKGKLRKEILKYV